MKKRQITIKDIAKALHISPSTVSRSLADHPDISQETKNIVNAYAREHKYKPNALALSLRTNNRCYFTADRTLFLFFCFIRYRG